MPTVRFHLNPYRLLAWCAVVLVAAATAATADAAATAPQKPGCDPALDFEDTEFPSPTTIDNRYLPLVPGRELVLDGQADRGAGLVPHRVVFTVTGVTKVIAGIQAVVVWDRDFSDGELVEEELAFWAQDEDGNVWNLGEYPEELEGGVVTGAPSTWLAGIQDAVPGIHMFRDARMGSSWYLQGSAPEIDFLDCARVMKTGEKVCVPAGCFKKALVTEERSPLDHAGSKQRKFHAPGVGIVQITGNGRSGVETLTLTQANRLDASDLAAANSRVLALDAHAYVVRPDVWASTPPAHT